LSDACLLQVVFRKIADVLREKELAERDRYDPPIELSTDHPVRRLISRFRKLSCSRLPLGAAGLPLSDFSAGDTLTVETSAVHARKTHSVDATNCSAADVGNGPSTSESTTENKCAVSNGGTSVSGGSAAWKRLLSRASSSDVTAAAAAIALPSNGDKTIVVNSSTTVNSEERALLSDKVVQKTARGKWSSLLSRVGVAENTTTNTDEAAATNEVFDDEEVSEKSSPVKELLIGRPALTVDATVELRTNDAETVSSSCADDTTEQETCVRSRRRHGVVRSLDDDKTVCDIVDLRSELNRQLGSVHDRIDDISRRLELVLRLLADTAPLN